MLEVAMKTTIKTLHEQGYNKTQISRMLGIDRKTIRKVIRTQEDGYTEIPGKEYRSQFDPYRDYILAKLEKGLTIKRIYQDMLRDHEITGTYSGVRHYVQKHRPPKQDAFMVLHSLPGEEAQVDFGFIGRLNVCGKTRKAWVFIMILSHSRYMYAEITLDQSVKTFIMCHVRAFRYFNGVPKIIKIDNLKAAITQADFYEPLVQRTYAEFAKHYGFLPQPCRVYTPTDKGKAESAIKYVKDNCFKERNFTGLEESEKFLSNWLETTANKRIHGTTQKVPAAIFKQDESNALGELPNTDFTMSASDTAIVGLQCHISYKANYYSAPYQYINCNVDVIEVNNLLKIYFKGKEIALHTLETKRKGEHVTDKNHYPASKNISQAEILSSITPKIYSIGSGAAEFLERHVKANARDCQGSTRALNGLLGLRKKYPDEVINQACMRACHFGRISYQTVKTICEKGLDLLPLGECEQAKGIKNISASKVRNLDDYRKLSALGVISHE
jgi:transposase